MPITISERTFQGPYKNSHALRNSPGIYAILCRKDSKLRLIDVGESEEVRTAVEQHGRTSCWQEKCTEGSLEVAALYTPHHKEEHRQDIADAIRDDHTDLCEED